MKNKSRYFILYAHLDCAESEEEKNLLKMAVENLRRESQ